jgi:hypothetical protein
MTRLATGLAYMPALLPQVWDVQVGLASSHPLASLPAGQTSRQQKIDRSNINDAHVPVKQQLRAPFPAVPLCVKRCPSWVAKQAVRKETLVCPPGSCSSRSGVSPS